MNNNILEQERTLSKDEFLVFESELGCELPERYKDFILKNNGGTPEYEVYEAEDERLFYVHEFHSIKYGEYPIEEILENFKELGVSIDYFPFACNEGGGHFCIFTGKASYGEIFLLVKDGTAEKPVYVAPSFEVFFDRLKEEDEEYDF